MEINIKVNGREDLIEKNVDLWSRFFSLTDKEKTLYKTFVLEYDRLYSDGVKEPYASQLIFSTDSIKRIKEDLKLSNQYYGNLREKLVKKKILIEKDGFSLNPGVFINDSITFNFV